MKKVFKVIFAISFVFYMFVLFSILYLRPNFQHGWSYFKYIKYSINIIPFKNISRYITALCTGSMNISTPITNLGGNLILLFPMGFYLPFFIKKIKKVITFSIWMIIIIFFLEVIQLCTGRGAFDIDDIILNTVGAILGFLIWKTKLIQKLLK